MLFNAKGSSFKKFMVAAAIPMAFAFSNLSHAAAPLKIAYSDWPGFVAWQVAIDKGWFKEAGVDVKFDWFDYGASMDAFTAGKEDAVFVTNGDALVVGSGGAINCKKGPVLRNYLQGGSQAKQHHHTHTHTT
jgi:NitT/TauT family transport system substrate-binding protein